MSMNLHPRLHGRSPFNECEETGLFRSLFARSRGLRLCRLGAFANSLVVGTKLLHFDRRIDSRPLGESLHKLLNGADEQLRAVLILCYKLPHKKRSKGVVLKERPEVQSPNGNVTENLKWIRNRTAFRKGWVMVQQELFENRSSLRQGVGFGNQAEMFCVFQENLGALRSQGSQM